MLKKKMKKNVSKTKGIKISLFKPVDLLETITGIGCAYYHATSRPVRTILNTDPVFDKIKNAPTQELYPVEFLRETGAAIIKARKLVFHPGGVLRFSGGYNMEYGGFAWVAVVAQELLFYSKDVESTIDLSTQRYDRSRIDGKNGTPGRHGIDRPKSTTGHGENGGPGFPGYSGGTGSRWVQPTLFLYVKKVVVQNTQPPTMSLVIDASGADGGNAGNGGNAGKGGHGGDGRDSEMDDLGLRCKERAWDGGNGGIGGNGGDSGRPSSGSDGGDIIFGGTAEVQTVLQYAQFRIAGGDGGHGAHGGKRGLGGDPGARGERKGLCDGGSRGDIGSPGLKDGDDWLQTAPPGKPGSVYPQIIDVDQFFS